MIGTFLLQKQTNNMNSLISLPIEVFLETRSFLYPDGLHCPKPSPQYHDFISKENCWSWRNFLSISNRQGWRAVRKAAMIWSLNRYEIKKYLEDDSFRAMFNNLVMGSRQTLEFILSNAVEYSLTQLRIALDTSYVGRISISHYQFAEFPSCRTVRTLIVNLSAWEVTKT
jgi:hypothetical protein